jgi:putative peptidoglycan lipid II flippase
VLQLLLQLAALHRRGFRWRLSAGLRHPEVRRVGAAMAPVALGLGVLQINVLLDGVLAISLSAPAGQSTFSLLGLTLPYPMQVGANSVLYYGNRLMQFPLGVFGIALATAAFPTLSRLVARRDWEGFSRSVVRGLGAGLFVALPASVGLILLSRPLTALVFERGEFTALMTARTADVIAAYSVGMWAYFSLHMLTRAFYSLGRQGTPAVVGGVMVAVNLVLNLALVWPLREAGLAAATSVSAMLQVVLLLLLLSRHVPLTGFGELARGTARTAGATACMAAAAWAVLAALGPAGGLALKTARVLLPAAAGAAVYAGAAAALGSREMRAIWASLRPKRTAAGKAGPADETKAAA